ncbi:amidohydrolase family protein [Sulfitobacter sp. 1A05707]|uniref:amidohydrolase family protein n=1 Tax=Sulfitobacter sp. 1A05707 TaxID=3368560 RepID=UPI003746AA33
MFRHMAQCLHDHSRHFRDPHVMMPRDVLEMCTIDAAKAIGLEDELGPLEAAKKADIVMLNLREPHLYPPMMPLTTIPQFANAAYVETVIVNGNTRMRDRKTTLNESDILGAAAGDWMRPSSATASRICFLNNWLVRILLLGRKSQSSYKLRKHERRVLRMAAVFGPEQTFMPPAADGWSQPLVDGWVSRNVRPEPVAVRLLISRQSSTPD